MNFTGILEDDTARTDLISEKQKRTTLNFSLDTLNVTEQYKQRNIKDIEFIK